MPDRWPSRSSTVTLSAISGRSRPSAERAVVERSSRPSSIRLTTVSAVSPFVPLARPNCVSVVFGIPCPRSARPYAFDSSTPLPFSTRTTPENPARSASAPTSCSSEGIGPRWYRVLGDRFGRLVSERRLHLRGEPLQQERREQEHRAGDDEGHRPGHRREESEAVEEELAERHEEQRDAAHPQSSVIAAKR